MPERRVAVGSSVGLHARPAALFTRAAAKVGVPVTIAKVGGEGPVDARSILLVLTLGVGPGDEVVIAADGEGADAALDHLAALLASDLDASPAGS